MTTTFCGVLTKEGFSDVIQLLAWFYAAQGLKGAARRFNCGNPPHATRPVRCAKSGDTILDPGNAAGLTPFQGEPFSLDVPGVRTRGESCSPCRGKDHPNKPLTESAAQHFKHGNKQRSGAKLPLLDTGSVPGPGRTMSWVRE